MQSGNTAAVIILTSLLVLGCTYVLATQLSRFAGEYSKSIQKACQYEASPAPTPNP